MMPLSASTKMSLSASGRTSPTLTAARPVYRCDHMTEPPGFVEVSRPDDGPLMNSVEPLGVTRTHKMGSPQMPIGDWSSKSQVPAVALVALVACTNALLAVTAYESV